MTTTTKIVRSVDVEVHLTVDEIIEAWCGLDAEDQAIFFNRINQPWLSMQLQYISGEPGLSIDGRLAMRKIGEYAQ